ncbi:hypothetical protein PMPD1_4174 [Paramixta manurensis]|uniref:DUF2231 domain-containing protein n=1 Tax=Paramixta manurensis TaxID=2740817 RepID=A0A6M8UE99_9GAMM|nr:hypothetical protein PMPD1_4174 [Erwiniaceae bacterium PD-1]
MTPTGTARRHSGLALALYGLLNPIPPGFFIAAWIFDIIYVYSYNSLWTLAATWLITFGLIISIIPRLINLVHVWVGANLSQTSAPRVDFWLNVLVIILSIFNAFIHSRDAYAVVPQGVIISTLVVLLLCVTNIQLALRVRQTYEG